MKNNIFHIGMCLLLTIGSGAGYSQLSLADSASKILPPEKNNKSETGNQLQHLYASAVLNSSFDEAIAYSNQLYKSAIGKGNQDEVYAALTEMVEVNRLTGNYEKGFLYAQQLLKIAIETGNKERLVFALWNLGQLYTGIEDYKEALNVYRQARGQCDVKIDSVLQSENKYLPFQLEFAGLFSLTNEFDSARYYYYINKPPADTVNSLYSTVTGECFYREGNYTLALRCFKHALVLNLEQHNNNESMRLLVDLGRACIITDSASAAIRYAFESLRRSLQCNASQYIRDSYKILSDGYEMLGMSGTSNHYFKKYAIIKDAIAGKMVAGRLAAYRYQERIDDINSEKKLQTAQLEKEKSYKNFLAAGLAVFLLLVVMIGRNVLLARKYDLRKRELAENNLKIEKLESEKLRAVMVQEQTELELKALRAQMNPHFIFNCLNAINRYIMYNNVQAASDYLTKFAKLIRMVLERSDHSLIPVQKELDFLRSYMDLEAIRFEPAFVYTINTVGIDLDNTRIPSLILQPFVENAIWHGLFPSTKTKKEITINLHAEKDTIGCEIIDNGVGINNPALKQLHTKTEKKSLGIEITRSRLALMNMDFQNKSQVSIRSIVNEKGENTGTCVTLVIPSENN